MKGNLLEKLFEATGKIPDEKYHNWAKSITAVDCSKLVGNKIFIGDFVPSGIIEYAAKPQLFLVSMTFSVSGSPPYAFWVEHATTFTLVTMNNKGELFNTGISKTSPLNGSVEGMAHKAARILEWVKNNGAMSEILQVPCNYTGVVGYFNHYAVFREPETALWFIELLFLGSESEILVWKSNGLIFVETDVMNEYIDSSDWGKEHYRIPLFPLRDRKFNNDIKKTINLWLYEKKYISEFINKK